MSSTEAIAAPLELSNLDHNGELLPADPPVPADELSAPAVAEARDTPPAGGGHVEAKGFSPPNVASTPTHPPSVQDLVIELSPTPSRAPSVASTAAPSVGAPSASSSSSDLTSTLSKIQSVVDRHLDLLAEGRLEQLPAHVEKLMDRMFEHHRQNRGRTPAFKSGSSSGGGSSSSGSNAPRHGTHRSGGSNSRRPVRKERPRCTHPPGAHYCHMLPEEARRSGNRAQPAAQPADGQASVR